MEMKSEPSDLMNLSKPELVAIILEQHKTITRLEGTIILLEGTIVRLEERIRQLEAQIHKDSHNSHIPPSRSPHVPIKNLREKTGKDRGGQIGHTGKTLEMVNHPTHIIMNGVARCERCGKDLSDTLPLGYERRQVFDIPTIICEVTEYRAEKKKCSCGQVTTALFPKAVSAQAQYGINIQSLVSIFSTYEYLGYNRISELLEQLIGYRVNQSTIYSFQNKLSENLADFEEKSKGHLCRSDVIHNDETGISVEGKSQWTHVTSSPKITHYAIDNKRGKEATDRIGILPCFQGTTVHDGWKSYFQYDACKHALCNAHHLRELTFFEEEEKASWARPLKDLLLSAKALVEKAQNEGQDHLDSESLQSIESRYCEILEEALANMPPLSRTGKRGKLKKTKQQNCIERLLDHKENALAFLYDFRIPFDNNLAERDIRMVKLKDKISGTFRSLHGACCFARIRGYISTVRKNDRNVFEEIKNAFSGKPFLLQEW
jgi:transposase